MARRKRLLAVAMALVATAACGIRTDSAPRVIDDPDAVIDEPATGGADAAGPDRIFLVGPDHLLLRSVQREAPSTQNLIEVLLRGPNEAELDAQWQSAIPPTTQLLSNPRRQGTTLFLDFSPELTTLPAVELRQALAQIVYTAAEDDGVEAVQITIDGRYQPLPKGNGETTTGPLRPYDYPGYVLTAQPAYPALPAA